MGKKTKNEDPYLSYSLIRCKEKREKKLKILKENSDVRAEKIEI